MAHDLDRKHEDRYREHRSAQVLQIADDAVVTEPVEVVIKERSHSAAQRHLDAGGWGLKCGDQAQQVAQRDENTQGAYHRDVGASFMTDDLFVHTPYELQHHFHRLLELPRILDRKLQAQESRCHKNDQDDEDLHGDVIGDGIGRIGRNVS